MKLIVPHHKEASRGLRQHITAENADILLGQSDERITDAERDTLEMIFSVCLSHVGIDRMRRLRHSTPIERGSRMTFNEAVCREHSKYRGPDDKSWRFTQHETVILYSYLLEKGGLIERFAIW